MSYKFTLAQNVMKIAEQEYGTAAEIRFTIFTSCIGLISRNNDKVTGVHLVMFSNTDDLFDNAAADAAVQLLGSYSKVVVIGQTNMWAGQIPAYNYLIQKLNKPVIIDKNDGIYGGRVNGSGIFQTYQDGVYVNVP